MAAAIHRRQESPALRIAGIVKRRNIANLAESKNYAATLSILDLAFGTFHYRPGRVPERLGVLDQAAYPNSNELWKVMKLPFVSRA